MNQWVDRLKAATKEKGWTYAELGRRSKVSKDSVDKYVQGKVENPRGATLKKLATALNVSEVWLKYGQEEAPGSEKVKPEFLPVVGAVQGGSFLEAEATIDPIFIPVVPSPEYADLKQYLLKVIGPSMNLVYPEGSYLHCAHIEYTEGATLEHGSRVIAERRLGDLREVTVKEYVITQDGAELWPRSTHPKWQKPLELYRKGVDEVIVTALVIGCYIPN